METNFQWWVIISCLQEEDEGIAPGPTRASFSAPQDLLNDVPKNSQVSWVLIYLKNSVCGLFYHLIQLKYH